MKLLMTALFCLIAGCSSQIKRPSDVQVQQTALDGYATAAKLQALFNDTRADCGGPSRPAFLCSGIMGRATVKSTAYKVWNPSPSSVTRGGVSWSWVRRDSSFRTFYYNNGYFVYPIFDSPSDKIDIDVFCMFPMNAGTVGRSENGCGAMTSQPLTSRPCHLSGITTAQQWLNNYRTNNAQCGFNVRETSAGDHSASAYIEGVRAMALLGATSFQGWNEVVSGIWPQNIHRAVPLWTFFYTGSGLPDAQYNQLDFYNASGGIVAPIIRVTMPTVQGGNASFQFFSGEQVVGRWAPSGVGQGEYTTNKPGATPALSGN
ncbi:MAG: halovibrin HvnC [Pseudomonas sp.]|jgi:hypothetical protein